MSKFKVDVDLVQRATTASFCIQLSRICMLQDFASDGLPTLHHNQTIMTPARGASFM